MPLEPILDDAPQRLATEKTGLWRHIFRIHNLLQRAAHGASLRAK
jgi:hypothetical protein